MKKLFVIFISISLMASAFAQQAKMARISTDHERVPGTKIVQTFPERAPGQFSPNEFAQRQQELFNRLVAEQAPLSEKTLFSVSLNSEDRARMESLEECESCGISKKLLVGIEKSAGIGIDFTNLTPGFRLKAPRIESNGMMVTTHDGGYVWSTAVEAKDAVAMRVHFSDFRLPDNAALYIYNEAGQAFGPYTGMGPNGDGEFWTNTVTGSMAFIQLRHTGSVTREDLSNTVFVIEDIDHLGPKFLNAIFQNRHVVHNKTCSFNASCVENAECFGTGDWSAINDARNAVASILFSSRGGLYICSGGLLNDTDASTQIPYFLTANHCISKKREAQSMETYFQFRYSSCTGACIGYGSASTTGSTVRSTSRTSDYTLLELSQNPPSGSVFLGWTSAAVAFSNGTDLYRISHPKGAPQSYSEHSVDTSAGTCTGWPRGNWIYSRDTVGATEGGSSGSVVCNASGQVVGQLSGACGFNVNNACDSQSNATVDGAFAAYFSSVAQYLNP